MLLLVLGLVRAEKLHQKKSCLPSTPRNLSIHKDISRCDEYETTHTQSIPVLKGRGGGEELVGEL